MEESNSVTGEGNCMYRGSEGREYGRDEELREKTNMSEMQEAYWNMGKVLLKKWIRPC